MLFNMFYQICIKFTSLQPVQFFIGSRGLPHIPYNLYIYPLQSLYIKVQQQKKGRASKHVPFLYQSILFDSCFQFYLFIGEDYNSVPVIS